MNQTGDVSPAKSDRLGAPPSPVRAKGLNALFRPRSVAVVGASANPASLGHLVFRNLKEGGFQGRLMAVNVRVQTVLGQETVASLREVATPPDLVVIAIPASAVEGVIDDCVAVGVQAAIILSAGFEQLENGGREVTARILQKAKRAGLRLIGPNCLGVLNPAARLNASFATTQARPGRLAFLSQSGALCTAILDWSLSENVGFSGFASVGSMLDVDWADLLSYFAEDPATDCILAYIESIGDARAFLMAARHVALSKPIIVLKAGRTAQAAAAAVSHTGAMACQDDVFEAAMQRVGILRVDQLAELFHVAELLSKQPRPRGQRLTIVTNAGGPAILATDTLVAGGGELAPLSADLKEALDGVLPAYWSHANPIDIGGDADPGRFAAAVEIAARNPNSDGLLLILTPQAMTQPEETARRLTPILRASRQPVLASWIGGQSLTIANDLLNTAGIPTYAFPESAARAFNNAWRYQQQLHNLYETPEVSGDFDSFVSRRSAVESILDEAERAGRTLLTEDEAKAVLRTYHIPTTLNFVATTADEAIERSRELGFPVVLKLHSTTITHKAEVGGVRLDLRSPEDVRTAFDAIRDSMESRGCGDQFHGVSVQPYVRQRGVELLLGAFSDSQFGPCLMFGSGGSLTEALRDKAVALPPLNTTLARRLIDQTRIAAALKGKAHQPRCDLSALERIIVAFGELLVEHPRIREADLNPILATPEAMTALDARIVLHPSGARIAPPAIRPYPLEYVRNESLTDGSPVRLRPIRLEDEPGLVAFHKTLSEDTLRNRYFGLTSLSRRIDHQRLIRHCLNDFESEVAIVVEHRESGDILGVGRLSRERQSPTAEFSLVVSDAWHRRGMGRLILDHLIEIGRHEGIRKLIVSMLFDNVAMRQLCRRFEFEARPGDVTDDVMQMQKSIMPADNSPTGNGIP